MTSKRGADDWAGVPAEGEPLTLDELVEHANALLPRYLPAEVDDARMREGVNPRLVRHLTTLGLIDEAGRDGREARYGLRHLLQLLVARRLMAQGFTTGAISGVVSGQDDEHLKSLLTGDLHLTMQLAPGAPPLPSAPPAKSGQNEALEYLQKLARRSGSAHETTRASPVHALATRATAPPNLSVPYLRLEVRPGLELHVTGDFRLPSSPHERDVLLQEVLQLLKSVIPASRVSRRK